MKRFIKRPEDFICQECLKLNVGLGYTNHCRFCLTSKHIDINPGDRMSNCGGLMKISEIEIKGQDYHLTFTCLKCGFSRKNKMSKDDNFNEIIRLYERV